MLVRFNRLRKFRKPEQQNQNNISKLSTQTVMASLGFEVQQPEPRSSLKISKPIVHHRNVANPTTSRPAGSKRALKEPTREDSEAQNSRAVKRQYRDNAGSNGPESPDTSILAAFLLLPHPSDPPAILETKLTKILNKLASGQSIR